MNWKIGEEYICTKRDFYFTVTDISSTHVFFTWSRIGGTRNNTEFQYDLETMNSLPEVRLITKLERILR